MSKVIQPFGTVTKEINIRADEKGLIIVEAWEYPPFQLGPVPRPSPIPMDSRYMVLALQKVVMDYCAVIFQGVTGSSQKVQNGQENNNDDKTSG